MSSDLVLIAISAFGADPKSKLANAAVTGEPEINCADRWTFY